jgi:hypothetical protein
VNKWQLVTASLTEPVDISFEWQFFTVSGRIVAFLPFTVRHHLCTRTVEFHTSLRAAIRSGSRTDKRQVIFAYCYVYSLSWPLSALPTCER